MDMQEGGAGRPGSLTCSFFNHAEDAVPTPWTGSWPSLVSILERTNRPRHRAKDDDPKKGLPAIAGATFEPSHRGKEEAKFIGLLGLDYDNAREEVIPGEFHRSGTPKTRKVLIDRPVTMEEVAEILWDAGAAAYLHSTWSSRDDWTKLRALVPLAEPVPAHLWVQATEWALTTLGLQGTRRGLDIRALRDVARIYFLPGHPDGPCAIRRQEVAGELLKIPLEKLTSMEVPESPRLPHIERELQRRHHEGYAWASNLLVDLSTLRLADLMADKGIKVGPGRSYRGGTKWRTRCLWPGEHTGGVDDDCAVVIHEPGRWPTWHCSHASHEHLSLVDVLRAMGALG